MKAIVSFITDKFGPWMFGIIETILRWGLFSLFILGLWIMDLFKWIAWGVIFGAFIRFIDRSATYLVIK